MVAKFEVFDARDLLAFPKGDNNTDTVFAGVHFNLTTLEHWNYTFYSNGTLSNSSKCWLTYEPYEPALLFTNGSFVNATKCYSAVDPIGTRGNTGIGFACAFGLGLMLTLTVLAKHGKLYLPKEKRFFPIGRRWQWYWGLFVCACALISLFINIDVDRYHVQELPIIVTSFFWYLICQGTTALVWEAVRHWGSWQERQFIDPNPFIYKTDDRRSMVEFWMPLWFYLWTWLNFFMVVPRSWKFAEMQRSPDQTLARAIPGASGVRFKIAAFCLLISWLTIIASLLHSIHHYRERRGSMLNKTGSFLASIPFRFLLIIPLCLVMIVYQAYIPFKWDLSIINAKGNVAAIYVWGYGPSLLIVFIQVLYGMVSPNEDKELIRQRRVRGDLINRELGLVAKPAWWRRVKGEHLFSLKDRIANNVNEIGGKRGVGRRVEDDFERAARMDAEGMANHDDGFEMNDMGAQGDGYNPRVDRAGVKDLGTAPRLAPEPMRYQGRNERRHAERIVQSFAGVLFPNNADAERARRVAELSQDGPPPPYKDDASVRRPSTPRRASTSTTNSITSPPQKVRSMLDL